MSGNPVSIQHQGYARLLSENTLQGTGTHRTSGWQAQTLQAYRTSMREDGAELRLVRRACSRLHLDQIRPHGLVPHRALGDILKAAYKHRIQLDFRRC